MKKLRILTAGSNSMNRLSLFCDRSGRLCEDSQHSPFFTASAIVIPTEDEAKVRGAMGQKTPKWRDSDTISLSSIENVLQNHEVYCIVVRIRKTDPAWREFWGDGKSSYDKLASAIRFAPKSTTSPGTGPEEPARPTAFKPGNVLNEWALDRCLALGLGSYIHVRGEPKVLGPDGLSPLYLRVTCDTDIEGQENQDAFRASWDLLCARTKIPRLHRIRLNLDAIEFKKEEDESLLLLPDYIAGYAQYSSDETRHVRLPAGLQPQDAQHFGQVLSALATSQRFTAVDRSFDAVYPELRIG